MRPPGTPGWGGGSLGTGESPGSGLCGIEGDIPWIGGIPRIGAVWDKCGDPWDRSCAGSGLCGTPGEGNVGSVENPKEPGDSVGSD